MFQNYVSEVKIPLGLSEFHSMAFRETQEYFWACVCAKSSSAFCPHCRIASTSVHSRRWRTVKDWPLHEKPVYLRIHKRRFRCLTCCRTFTEKFASLAARARMTHRLAHKLSEAPQSSFREVAKRWGVTPKLVARTFKQQAQKALAAHVLEPIAVLGIDENSFRKRLRYNIVLTDLARGHVVDILPGRSPHTLIEWLRTFPYRHLIRWVVTDLHRPFVKAVRVVCPHVVFIADRFHLIRNLNRHLCTVKEQGLKDNQDLRYPRGLRWNLIMARERLTSAQKDQLEAVFQRYPPLGTAYGLKEQFRAMYHLTERRQAQEALMDWIFAAEQSGLPKFQEYSRVVRRWEYPILDWFSFHITNGYTEGANNTIKLIKRIGYGAMNFETLRLKILMSFR